jgi:hypothetical protein
MSWRYGRWSADHALPLGVTDRREVGATVNAGEVIAEGVVPGGAVRVAGARHLAIGAHDMGRVMRVAVGGEVARGAILARTGRRFARVVKSPLDGRVLHVTDDGDVYVAPVAGRWAVRATVDGEVVRTDDACVTVEGEAWCLGGVAAFGPDAVGELALAVEGGADELAPSRIDVRLGGRILVGGARIAAEAVTRAHACGVAALVAGAAPAAGLRLVFGDAATASGAPSREGLPTVLCLVGFGASPLPPSIFDALRALAGSRAAIHTGTARLFVFAAPDAAAIPETDSPLAIAADYGSVRPFAGACVAADEVRFPSEVTAPAVRCDGELYPAANVLPFGVAR